MKDLTSFISILFSFLVLTACKSEKPEDFQISMPPNPEPDYRDTYTGTYNCEKYCYAWNVMEPTIDTTYDGPVEVLVSKDVLTLDHLIVDGDTVYMDTSGTYSGVWTVGGYHSYFITFRNDSLLLFNSMGGLGMGTDCSVIGRK